MITPSTTALEDAPVVSGIKTYIRIRGLTTKERQNNLEVIMEKGPHNNTVSILDPLYYFQKAVRSTSKSPFQSVFAADACFFQDHDQRQVYKECGYPLLAECLNGYNSTFLCYGQTSSGKTFTAFGTVDHPGILPLLCADAFKQLGERSSATTSWSIAASFVEVYNERVFDLLGSDTNPCKLRENADGAYIQSLSVTKLESADALCALISTGQTRRSTGQTLMNANSSRSHALFTLHIEQQLAGSKKKRSSKLCLVDLAGSEKANVTGAAGDRLVEANNINKSLSTLSDVISALREKANMKRTFIPYRNSVLTWLLKPSLEGNCAVRFLATLSPTDACYLESLSTLRFLEKVKAIKKAVITVNETAQSNSEEVSLLKRTVAALKKQIEELTMGKALSSEGRSLAELWPVQDEHHELGDDSDSPATTVETSPPDKVDGSTCYPSGGGGDEGGPTAGDDELEKLQEQEGIALLLKGEMTFVGEGNAPEGAKTLREGVGMSEVKGNSDLCGAIITSSEFSDYSNEDLIIELVKAKVQCAQLQTKCEELAMELKNMVNGYCQAKFRLASIATDYLESGNDENMMMKQ